MAALPAIIGLATAGGLAAASSGSSGRTLVSSVPSPTPPPAPPELAEVPETPTPATPADVAPPPEVEVGAVEARATRRRRATDQASLFALSQQADDTSSIFTKSLLGE